MNISSSHNVMTHQSLRQLLVTSVCLDASIWTLGHLRSDRHVSNLRRPDCC